MSDERTPFWKKELSLGRKQADAEMPRSPLDAELEAIKQAAIADVTPTAPAEPAPRPVQALPFELTTIAEEDWEEPKVPFWKKEIGGGKKEKAPKQKRSKPVKVNELDPETPLVEQPKPEKVPFWKKEIGGKKQSSTEKAAREAKPKPARAEGDRPFWRNNAIEAPPRP